MNKFDIHAWVKKIIDSCENFPQWARCIRLIQRYEILYPEDKADLSTSLRTYHNYKLIQLNQDEKNS